jgi:preprotein translocase subunit SecA
MNFDLRKHVLEYDDVMNKHREVIYKKRKEVLEKFQNNTLREQVLEIFKKSGFKEEEYLKKEKEVGEEKMRQIEKVVSLRIIDAFWMEHLENMEHLRDSVRLRAYGQRDPLVEYKSEGHRMFQKLLGAVDLSIAETITRVSIVQEPVRSQAAGSKSEAGRNDPCPCGSGKKYKKCHGKGL